MPPTDSCTDPYSGQDSPCNPQPGKIDSLSAITAVSGGESHSLALRDDGEVFAWGENQSGEVGDGTITPRPAPVQVEGIAGVAAVGAGAFYSLALTSDGTVWNWGRSIRIGVPSGRVPTQISGLVLVAPGGISRPAVAAGDFHALALKSDGTVWAWGNNSLGQLGTGSINGPVVGIVQVVDPADPSGYLSGVKAIAAGNTFSMALKHDGSVWAWGDNSRGELGRGTHCTVPGIEWCGDGTPTRIDGLDSIVGIDAGFIHAAAVDSDGRVWMWGWNEFGQLGSVPMQAECHCVPTPTLLDEFSGVAAVSVGTAHSLALKQDGTVWGWGNNSVGQIGPDLGTAWPTPRQIPGLQGIKTIWAGNGHSLASTLSVPDVTPPNALQVSNPTTSSLTLGWNDNSDNETGFRIERQTEGSSTWVHVKNTAANATSWTNVGLTADTTYTYRVRAFNADGATAWSNQASNTTLSPPSVPTDVSVINPTPSSLTVTWTDASDDETGFRIERQTQGSGTWLHVKNTNPNETSWTNFALAADTTYTFRVRAFNTVGASVWTPEASNSTLAPPATPTNVSVINPTASSLTVTWTDASDDETGFRIERQTEGSSTWLHVKNVAANETSWTNFTLASDTTYTFRVRAFNAGGASAWADAASNTTLP